MTTLVTEMPCLISLMVNLSKKMSRLRDIVRLYSLKMFKMIPMKMSMIRRVLYQVKEYSRVQKDLSGYRIMQENICLETK